MRLGNRIFLYLKSTWPWQRRKKRGEGGGSLGIFHFRIYELRTSRKIGRDRMGKKNKPSRESCLVFRRLFSFFHTIILFASPTFLFSAFGFVPFQEEEAAKPPSHHAPKSQPNSFPTPHLFNDCELVSRHFILLYWSPDRPQRSTHKTPGALPRFKMLPGENKNNSLEPKWWIG